MIAGATSNSFSDRRVREDRRFVVGRGNFVADIAGVQ